MSVKRKDDSSDEEAETKKARTGIPYVGGISKYKLANILLREIQNELNYRKKQVELIQERIALSKQILNKLRQAIVSDYYRQQIQNGGQLLMHPVIKKIVSKRTKSIKIEDGIETADPPSHHGIQNNLTDIKEEPLSSEEDEISQDTCSSVASPQPSTSSASDVLIDVPRYILPKLPDNDIKQTIIPRNPLEKQKLRLIIGNTSKWLGPSSSSDVTHKWTVYIRSVISESDIVSFIAKVKFFLHSSYKPNDIVTVDDAPFKLTRLGWGEFPLKLQIFFTSPLDKPVEVIHNIKLDHTCKGINIIGQERVCEFLVHGNSYTTTDNFYNSTGTYSTSDNTFAQSTIENFLTTPKQESTNDLRSVDKMEENQRDYCNDDFISEGKIKLEPVPHEAVEVSFVYPDSSCDNIIDLEDYIEPFRPLPQNELLLADSNTAMGQSEGPFIESQVLTSNLSTVELHGTTDQNPQLHYDVEYIDNTDFANEEVCIATEESPLIEIKEGTFDPSHNQDMFFDSGDMETLSSSNFHQLLDSMFPQCEEEIVDSQPAQIADVTSLESEQVVLHELEATPEIGEVQIVSHGKTVSHQPINVMVMRKSPVSPVKKECVTKNDCSNVPITTQSNLAKINPTIVKAPSIKKVVGNKFILTNSKSLCGGSFMKKSSKSDQPNSSVFHCADHLTTSKPSKRTKKAKKAAEKINTFHPLFIGPDGSILNLVSLSNYESSINSRPLGQTSKCINGDGKLLRLSAGSLVVSPPSLKVSPGNATKSRDAIFNYPGQKKVIPGISVLKKPGHETTCTTNSRPPKASAQQLANPSKVAKLSQKRSELLKCCPVEKVEFAVSWLLKHFPIVDRGATSEVFRVLYPYCTTDPDSFLSWPIPKQRAAELFRVKDVMKHLHTLFSEEFIWQTEHVFKFARIRGFTPVDPTDDEPSCEHSIYFPLTPLPNFQFKKRDDDNNEEIDIVGLNESMSCDNSTPENTDDTPGIKHLLLLNPEERALSGYIEKNCDVMHVYNLEIEELDGIWFPGVMKMLISCFKSLAEDLIRRSYSEAWKRYCDRPPPEVNVTDTLAAIMNREEFDLFTDEGLGQRATKKHTDQEACVGGQTGS